ncbi:antirestriction protein ArdA [Chryseobacterium sp. JM1]|uniref:antirestriction protein ArdA n=1 Tax=Chryseobacterium sp. JM1 TaxID=1233950 RepID=UPI00068EE266|nr:antirestriction protein ArdA [Chryseobacterium sp. JM1]
MKKQIQIDEARVYVGTYKKYNEGSLYGRWIELSDYTYINEFYNVCKELHRDEDDPEYMFQDYENIPENLISESWINEDIFDIIQSIAELTDQHLNVVNLHPKNGIILNASNSFLYPTGQDMT